jgi:hypothetical protein
MEHGVAHDDNREHGHVSSLSGEPPVRLDE